MLEDLRLVPEQGPELPIRTDGGRVHRGSAYLSGKNGPELLRRPGMRYRLGMWLIRHSRRNDPGPTKVMVSISGRAVATQVQRRQNPGTFEL